MANNFIKPYVVKNFIDTQLFNWEEFEILKKDLSKKNIELIENGERIVYADNLDKNLDDYSLVFTGCRDAKKEFHTLHDFFKLKVPTLSEDWDAHIYTGHTDKPTSFKMHFDMADNFILQCAGKSRFFVPNYFDVIVEPGDLSWVPRYVPHVMVQLGRRLSISFPHFD